MTILEFTPEKRDSLRQAHKEAVNNNLDTFTWGGVELHTAYAGYLLEYLDGKFSDNVQKTNAFIGDQA